MDQKYNGVKRVFEKHEQLLYEHGKENYSFFLKMRVFAKKGPCGKPEGKQKKFLKNISKGDLKKGSAKGIGAPFFGNFAKIRIPSKSIKYAISILPTSWKIKFHGDRPRRKSIWTNLDPKSSFFMFL